MSIENENIPTPKPGASPLFGIIVMIVGGIMLAITAYIDTQSQASQDWPSTEGVVVASQIEEYRDADQEASYTPRIIYEYTVDGQRYASQQLKFSIEQSYGTQNGANKILSGYPIGKPVIVYYDPATPTNAVLDRSAPRIILWFVISGGLTLIGISTLLTALWHKLREEKR